MRDDLRLAFEITRREIQDQMRDWRMVFPILFLTLIFPFLMNFTAEQILAFIANNGINVDGQRMVPFLLMIVGFFPISVSLVVSLESFVGEKERGTIEPLLHTPLKDGSLYLGKLLSAVLPSLVASYLGMSVYLVGLVFKHIALPSPESILQILALTTDQAVMMVCGAVVVSSQATSVRAANLLASFIIIPVALLIQGESMVMFWGSGRVLWWVILGVLVLTVLLIRVGLAHFQREELLGREIDTLNLRWLGRLFWQKFVDGARNPWDWYLHSVPRTLRGMRVPLLLVTALAVIAVLVGAQQSTVFRIPFETSGVSNVSGRLHSVIDSWPMFDYHPLLSIWWQNVRALLLAFVLGMISFGILGILPLLFTLGAAGYLSSLVAEAGVPLGTYILGFFVPHGIIEIPVAILATAYVLRSGAVMASPSTGRTMGEVWAASIADFSKIMIGLVIPLLFIAAAIEAWATPRLALMLFGG